MRNVFDQYQQPENRLTHALISTLANERPLLRPFLRWLKVRDIPPLANLRLVEQQVPGVPVSGEEDESGSVPDACIYDQASEWAVLVEAKVQAKLDCDQLRRHLAIAKRCGYSNAQLVVLAVDTPASRLPANALFMPWRSVYRWFSSQHGRSGDTVWPQVFVDYMQQFEARMVSQNYAIRGTITMFDGLKFDNDNPYTYVEAKRVLRLLGDELQKRSDLRRLGVDSKATRRQAITGREGEMVWDYLPLESANGRDFTQHPHLTIGIRSDWTEAATTIPNGIKGGLKTKLRRLGRDGFRQLLTSLQRSLHEVVSQSEGSKPVIYLQQRHFPARTSPAEIDGRIEFDLRTLAKDKEAIRFQPQWADALLDLLANKRSNMQCGVMVRFRYDSQPVRSRKVVDLFAETWIATKPLLDFVLN